MNELDNLRMELEALKLFSAEQEEENERLRAENATLRDKLEQKGGVDLAKGPDYSSVEMLLKEMAEVTPKFPKELMRDLRLAAPQYGMYALYHRDQKIPTRQEDVLITAGFDEMNQCYQFEMRRDRYSEPHCFRLDERAAHEVDAWMIKEITTVLLNKVLGYRPDANLLNRTMYKLFERFMEAATIRMKDYDPYEPKYAKRLKRSPDDRDTRDHPRSPLQRGGR